MICGRSSGSGGHLAVLSHNRKLAHPHFSIPIFLLTGLTLGFTILFRDMFGGSHRLPFLFLCWSPLLAHESPTDFGADSRGHAAQTWCNRKLLRINTYTMAHKF
jgi:hypothetical protein